MRQVLGSALFGLVALAGAAGDVSAQVKLGYVNTPAVIAAAPGRTTAEAEFNRRMAPLNAEVQKMDSTLKAMFAAFTRDTTSPMPQREAKAQEIQSQQQQFQQRVAAIEDTAAALRQRLMQPIMQQLETALEAVRKEGGYSMLFDVGQATVHVGGTLLFEHGLPHDDAAPLAAEHLKGAEVRIDVDLGTPGAGDATVWTCDLSAEYVRINGEYRT